MSILILHSCEKRERERPQLKYDARTRNEILAENSRIYTDDGIVELYYIERLFANAFENSMNFTIPSAA